MTPIDPTVAVGASAGRLFTFPWPRVERAADSPVWEGDGFRVGPSRHKILAYHFATGRWSHDLTQLHEREAGSSHPIDVISRRYAVRAVRIHAPSVEPLVLDVGSSSGYLVEDFKRALPGAQMICSDYLAEPLQRLADAHLDIPLLQFDVCKCPLPEGCVDAVLALSVLEHIDDDREALRQMFRILRPRGIAYLEAPAHPMLYGPYDKYLLHSRRYRMRDLLRVAAEAGFEIAESNFIGFFIFGPFFLVKLIDRWRGELTPEQLKQKVEAQIRSTKKNTLLRALLGLEFKMTGRIRYPTGVRCIVTLRRP